MGASASASLEDLDESTFLKFKKKRKNDFNELCELTVFGYIRRMEQDEELSSLIIPISIANVILDFFPPIPEFKWNKKIKGHGMIINDDGITIKGGFHWTSGIADFYVSSKMVDYYEWTIELMDWNRNLSDKDQPALMTGFVLYPFDESVKDFSTYLGATECNQQFMINICYIDTFRLFGPTSCFGAIDKINNISKLKFKSGDIIKLKIDFIKKQCRLFYNNTYCGIAYKNIPDKPIIPAVSLHQGSIKVCSWDAGFC